MAVEEVQRVNLLVQFYTLQMVKLWFVRLDFGEIFVVKVSTAFKFCVSKNNDSTSLVSYSQVFASLVERDGCEHV